MFLHTSASGLRNLVNGEINRDQTTRFLSQETKTAKDLWLIATPFVKRFDLKKAF